MRIHRLVAVLLILVVVASCAPSHPTPTPVSAAVPILSSSPTATPTLAPAATVAAGTPLAPGSSIRRVPQPGDATLLADLLEYIPAGLVDLHLSGHVGYPMHYIDVARIRQDLGIGSLTGADDRKAKLDLIAGLKIQGLELAPFELDPTAATAYEEWGWDIADVAQCLYLPTDKAVIVAGEFDADTVVDRLVQKGYSGTADSGSTIYAAADEEWYFVVDDDCLLISADLTTLQVFISQKLDPASSLAIHPSMLALLQEAQPMWGALLTTSSDLSGLRQYLTESNFWAALPARERAALHEFLDPSDDDTCLYRWDLALLTFRNAQEEPNQRYLYHYISEEQANEEAASLPDQLARVHSVANTASTWAEILVPYSSEAQGEVLVFEATTAHETMLGLGTMEWMDVGFLPIHCDTEQ